MEAQLFKSLGQGINARALIIGYKGGSKAYHNRYARLDIYLYLFGFIYYLLCILGTLHYAISTKNTLVRYDMCLISRKTYSLYRAFSYASETGLTI